VSGRAGESGRRVSDEEACIPYCVILHMRLAVVDGISGLMGQVIISGDLGQMGT